MDRLRYCLTQACDVGSAAVEFAIILPMFLVIVFGGISGSLAVTHKSAMTQAASEAARYGATLGLGAGVASWLGSVQTAAVAGAGADFTGGSPYWCVAYVAPSAISPAQVTASLSSTSGGVVGTTPCYADSRTDAHVQVELRRNSDFDMAVTDLTVTLDSRAVAQYAR